MINMKIHINKKYLSTILLIITAITTIILLDNYLTCPRYLNTIELDSFNSSLDWYKYYKFLNVTAIHYSGFLGEADFRLITYISTPLLHPITTPQDLLRMTVVVRKISEKTYNPLVKGFIILIERSYIFNYRIFYKNETVIYIYAYVNPHYKRFLPDLSEFHHYISYMEDKFPSILYLNIDYTIHAIINPYAEIQYSKYDYIITGFHIQVYSGKIIIPITITPG